MENNSFIINKFNKIDKKIVILGIAGGICTYFLNKKINAQSKLIDKLSEELNNRKGD